MFVNVCDCTKRKNIARFRIEVNQYGNYVDKLISDIADHLKADINELDVIYCGQKLQEEAAPKLSTCSTVYVFRKPVDELGASGTDVSEASKCVSSLQTALLSANYRKTVDNLVNSQQLLQQMMRKVPGLANDPVTLSMLQDPELLTILISRQNIQKVLKEHPTFGQAADYIARLVNEETNEQVSNRAGRSATYSLDRMSDDEEEGNQGRSANGGPQQLITTSQLAAALATATATATASARPPASGSSPLQPSTSRTAMGNNSMGNNSPSVISSDFFQQAMMQVQNAALDAQVQQLRDMGFQDENLARQVLAATNGDIQAALDLIFAQFGDGSN